MPPHPSSIILQPKEKKKEKIFWGGKVDRSSEKKDNFLGRRKAILWGEERQIDFLGGKKKGR